MLYAILPPDSRVPIPPFFMQVKPTEDTSCTSCTTHDALTRYQLHRVILRIERGPLAILEQKMVRNSFKNHIDLVSVLQ
jgi:hypothetical protein